jgi:3-oxoacyl-[acyl-carrier protein] reductase
MLENKTALVTGASRGIGREIALELARAGADVVLVMTRLSESAEKAAEEIRAMGRRAEIYFCDVSDMSAVTAMAVDVLQKFGRLDILVNNAGITRDKLLMTMAEEDFTRVLDVNLKGTYHVIRAFIHSLVKNRYGRIINISSVVGLCGNAGQANYAASKAGVIGLTKSVAKEYAARGITCNAIAPGYIETDMTQNMPATAKEAILTQIPLKRAGCGEARGVFSRRDVVVYHRTGCLG